VTISPASQNNSSFTAPSTRFAPEFSPVKIFTMALLTLNALLLSVSLASAACYDINFQLVTNPDAVPCNNVQGAISMCCDTNRGPSSPYTPDTCLPNGLCKSVFTNTTTGKPDTNYWREFCSDVGWNKQSCLTNICSSSSVSILSLLEQRSNQLAWNLSVATPERPALQLTSQFRMSIAMETRK
jgi:hypothetical protein